MYLVEAYVSRAARADVRAEAERASAAAFDMNATGRRVRYLRSMFLCEEETCFHAFEADAAATVAAVVERAGIECDRIVEAELLPRRCRIS